MSQETFKVIGEMVPFAEFYDKFHAWLPPEERGSWTRIKVSRALPVDHPSGAATGNVKHIGNLAWENKHAKPDAKLLVVKDGKLRKDNG